MLANGAHEPRLITARVTFVIVVVVVIIVVIVVVVVVVIVVTSLSFHENKQNQLFSGFVFLFLSHNTETNFISNVFCVATIAVNSAIVARMSRICAKR